MHSTTADLVKLLQVFIMYELHHPQPSPIKREKNPSVMKSTNTIEIEPAVTSSELLANLTMVLNRIIETASLTIPSPKTNENNLG